MMDAKAVKDITMSIVGPLINDEDRPEGILEILGTMMSLGILAGRYSERKGYPHPNNFEESIALMVKAIDDLETEGSLDELIPILQQFNASMIAMGEEPLDLDLFPSEEEAGGE